VAATKPDTDVEFGVVRGDDRLDIDVRLGELQGDQGVMAEAPDVQERLGFAVATLDNQLARRYNVMNGVEGVVVTSIEPHSSASLAGLREGDLIRSVGRQPVETESDFYGALEGAQAGDTILLRVLRGDNGFYIAFEIG
jgi:serine protease Do